MKIFPLFLAGMPVRVLSLCALISSLPPRAEAQVTTGFTGSAAGPYNYNDSANWVGGIINGIWDSSLTLTAGQAVTFGADTPLGTGLSFGYTGGSGVTLRADGTGPHTLTLGGNITVNPSGNATVNFGASALNQNLNVDLGGQIRTLNVASGRTLGFVNVISNGGLDIYGGTVNMSGLNTYTGDTRVFTGNLSLNGANGSIANSDVEVRGNSTLTIDSSANGVAGTIRAQSVTLNGAGGANGAHLNVNVGGGTTTNATDSISGALTTEAFARVTVSAGANRNARLTADSFVREQGSLVLFRGSNLGLNSIASQTAGSANIVFTTAPTLSGTGALGTTTAGILKGAYGDSTAAGNGTGLVTYEAANGVRLLTGAEYTVSITDGQTQLDNALLTNSSGAGVITTTLNSITQINSLSLGVSGGNTVPGSGLTINGSGTLSIASGMIYASQLVTGQPTGGNATNAMTLSVGTIDLNGQEGGIVVFSSGINHSNTAAPLYISSVIANDGGNGVTFGGSGQTILDGSAINTYTGPTTLNSGILRLAKTGAATATTLNTDLIMNGGTLLKNNNSIADTASVTIHAGSFVMDTTTSSGNNGSQETINNLTMTGGRVQGSGGSNSALTINGNMSLSGGLVQLNNGGDVTVLGNTTLNGGVLNARLSSSTSVANGLTALNTVSIANVASGTYTPIVLTAHATNLGALLTLNGDLTFTGNGTNTNTVRIDSSDTALANQGVIALNGERTFNIGNGAAAVDITIVPAITDSTSGDGLIKTGLGTMLLGGANTYTGATTVNAGALLIDGSSVSAVTVNGGVFGGTGTVSNSVSVGNDGTLAPGNSPGMLSTGELSLTGANATIAMEIGGIGAGLYDQINVTGGVNLDGNGQIAITMLSYVPQPTDIFFLILNDGVDAISGTLLGIAQGGTFTSGGYTWMVSYTGDSAGGTFTGGNDLALQVVPEPSTWVLLTGGLMVATLLRRRRHV
jgi:fibronectin-binding autotransporter adhesin